MLNRETTNNYCEISGAVASDISFSHEVRGEKFSAFALKSERLSGICDTVNVIFSENCPGGGIKKGDRIFIKGQFRSYNNYSGVGNKLILSVFAKEINFCADTYEKNVNTVILNGYLCKPPVYRTTPFGREITDILLAVNRMHNKSDYIPCIIWGKSAREAALFSVGDKLTVFGRIQSREYKKKHEDGGEEVKTAFEVSVNRMEKDL